MSAIELDCFDRLTKKITIKIRGWSEHSEKRIKFNGLPQLIILPLLWSLAPFPRLFISLLPLLLLSLLVRHLLELSRTLGKIYAGHCSFLGRPDFAQTHFVALYYVHFGQDSPIVARRGSRRLLLQTQPAQQAAVGQCYSLVAD